MKVERPHPYHHLSACFTQKKKQDPRIRAPRRRFHPGTVALREIRYYQATCDPCIALAPLSRAIRTMVGPPFRMSLSSVLMLRDVLENYLIQIINDAYKTSNVAHRVTLLPVDFH